MTVNLKRVPASNKPSHQPSPSPHKQIPAFRLKEGGTLGSAAQSSRQGRMGFDWPATPGIAESTQPPLPAEIHDYHRSSERGST